MVIIMHAGKLNDKQMMHWLLKTSKSLGNAYARAGYAAYNSNGNMKYEIQNLIGRYEELKSYASKEIWQAYCDKTAAGYEHNGNDLLS
jgi:hypothetical protein